MIFCLKDLSMNMSRASISPFMSVRIYFMYLGTLTLGAYILMSVISSYINPWASQVAPVVKNSPANASRCKRCEFEPLFGKIPCKSSWQPTPVFLPEESHGQRSLTGYSPQGCKELNMTLISFSPRNLI